jgi:hypothetical protein
MKQFFSSLRLTAIFGLAFCGFILPVSAQDEEYVPDVVTEWLAAPVYLSGGPTLSRFVNAPSGDAYPFRLKPEFGILFQYSLGQTYPFYSGLEFQMRGFKIDKRITGTTADGRISETITKGTRRTNYLIVPMIFSIPAKPERKLHFLAGISGGMRVYFRQDFTSVYRIPQDSLEITIEENKTGNNALDILEFNGELGASYRFHPKLELWAGTTIKLVGFSLATENFFSRNERNTLFRVKLLWRFASMEDLPFF